MTQPLNWANRSDIRLKPWSMRRDNDIKKVGTHCLLKIGTELSSNDLHSTSLKNNLQRKVRYVKFRRFKSIWCYEKFGSIFWELI